jgi:hypothetical protein
MTTWMHRPSPAQVPMASVQGTLALDYGGHVVRALGPPTSGCSPGTGPSSRPSRTGSPVPWSR